MSIRITGLAALTAAMLFVTGASSQAAYTLTGTGLNPTSATFGGTTFTFTAAGPQNGSTPSNFEVIDVAATSTTAPPASDSGMVTLSENFSLTGTPGTMSFTLTGTFLLQNGSTGGILSFYPGSLTNIVGSGYTVAFAGYAPPSPNSTPGSFNDGNISLTIIPNSVPEPASVAMLGLGLLSVGGVALRRRMAKPVA
jgi:PEP-CTERM motif